MKIFIYEYILSSNKNYINKSTLLNEAKIIISALAKDFSDNLDVNSIKISLQNRHFKFLSSLLDNNKISFIDADNEIKIKACISESDYAIILAPEENNVLSNIIKDFSKINKNLINCSPDFINLTSDKYLLYKKFAKQNDFIMPVYKDYKDINKNKKIIAKIRDGLSAEDMYLFKNRRELEDNIYLINDKHVFQEYLNGDIISVNTYFKDNSFKILSINEQIYTIKERAFTLKKFIYGKFNSEVKQISSCIEGIVNNCDGINGFIGFDIVRNKSKYLLIDINPRLTTSYVGLRKTLKINPTLFIKNFNTICDINTNRKYELNLNIT